MRDALRLNDQEQYFQILGDVDLLLPVSAEAFAGRAPMSWGTWTADGRTHLLAFTSPQALHACLAEHAGSYRQLPYTELAAAWPNMEWWLAVNPGLPIEAYLPSWFVVQVNRGDVRLPGRTLGARARIERASGVRTRAVGQVPRHEVPETPSTPQRAAALPPPPAPRPPVAPPDLPAPSRATARPPAPPPAPPAAPGPVAPAPPAESLPPIEAPTRLGALAGLTAKARAERPPPTETQPAAPRAERLLRAQRSAGRPVQPTEPPARPEATAPPPQAAAPPQPAAPPSAARPAEARQPAHAYRSDEVLQPTEVLPPEPPRPAPVPIDLPAFETLGGDELEYLESATIEISAAQRARADAMAVRLRLRDEAGHEA